MKKLILVIFILFTSVNAEEIMILAAASLKYVLEDIKIEFLKDKKDTINISYIASGKAYNQIVNGAPAHLFIAADTSYPQKLYDNKQTFDKPVNYIKGKLVLFSKNKNLNINSLDILKDDKIKHIALPNPKLAPYGVAAKEAMEASNIYDSVKTKIVLGESIGQATQYVTTGSSDIGFSALSMVIKDNNVNYLEVDSKTYSPILQAMVITNYGKDSKLAKEFKDFILSPKSQEIFKTYGYDKP
ncbi:molybdate ABC transporter substrate-binding protein [Helicobacter sp. MIT 14-3879]|uniref:molybdate ABC transporter substrate-binding protein n=1 Tax=Helicobacter sp. MIT 14-3879 TaxID=2040649 RepID=UPI000E1E9090|nr:molybdate ABC transporter substrate-binding protein [Helicobacter sp. MIT 14-3879]RDU63929.1 molybdate ABC transporter substrate-binding protein [Helicobacter sp. MIT 14-3879]